MSFVLNSSRWYACEIMEGAHGADLHSYSPIRVTRIEPPGAKAGRFELSSYYLNYPEGVRDKIYTLRTIDHGGHLLLAESEDHEPSRRLLIHDISWSWMREHFEVEPDRTLDVQAWLEGRA